VACRSQVAADTVENDDASKLGHCLAQAVEVVAGLAGDISHVVDKRVCEGLQGVLMFEKLGEDPEDVSKEASDMHEEKESAV